MADRMIGPFRLMALREHGVAGEVYLAWDTRLNERVEVTVLSSISDGAGADERSRFQRIIGRLAGLQHPSLLVPTQLSSPGSDKAWLATDHREGISLRELLDARGRLPWRLAALLLHEIAVALAWAHRHGVAHGCLSPRRVVIEHTGGVALAGFDVVARVALDGGDGGPDPRQLYDEPAYLAPEALQGRPPSLKGDLFALGILAWEMLAGQRPFSGPDAIARYAGTATAPPDPGETAPDLPQDLRLLVRALLAGPVAQRPSDAGFVRDKLREMLSQAGIQDHRATLRRGLEATSPSVGDGRGAGGTEPGVPAVEGGAGARPVPTSSRATRPLMPKAAGRRDPGSTADRMPRVRVVRSGSESRPPERESPAARSGEGAARKGPGAAVSELWSESSGRRDSRERSPAMIAGLLAALVVCGIGGLWLAFGEDAPWAAADTEARQAQATGGEAREPAPVEPAEVARVRPSQQAASGRGEVPETPEEVYAAKARELLEVGHAGLAERMARRGLEEGGGEEAELQMSLGRALAEQGEVDPAVRAFLAADEESGRATRGHMAAGFALAQAGRCGEAIPLFRDAARRGLHSAELYKRAGNCHLLEGEPEEAIAALTEAEALDGEDLDVLLPLARAFEEVGRPDAARERLERALELAPDRKRIHVALARVESKAGAPEDALARLDATDEGGEADVESLEVRGHAALEAGRYAAAAKAYGEAVEAAGDEASSDLLRNHAVALDRAGETRQAIAAYREAMEALPDDPDLPGRVGTLLAGQGRHGEAVRAFEEALGRGADWRTRFQKGNAELAAGRASDAVDSFSRVLAERPSDGDVLQNLGAAQVEAGRREEAAATYRRLADVRPNDPGPVLTAAALAQRMGRPGEAEALLREACRRGAGEACE